MFKYSCSKLRVAYRPNDAFGLLLKEPRWCSTSKLFVLHNVTSSDAMISKLVYSFSTISVAAIHASVHSFLNIDMFN